MRDDMAKVVTERPRRGHSNKSNKTSIQKIRRVDPEDEYEDHPKRLPVSRRRQYGYDCKGFTDLISPLQKYLKKQVGRPWDKIYSELSAKLDKRSLTGLHIWDHVKSEVERECYMGVFKKQKIAYYTRTYGWTETPVPVRGLYVNPDTGILCLQNKKVTDAYAQWNRDRYRNKQDAKEAARVATLTPTQRLLEQRRNTPSTINSFNKAERAKRDAQAAFAAAVEKHPEILKILAE